MKTVNYNRCNSEYISPFPCFNTVPVLSSEKYLNSLKCELFSSFNSGIQEQCLYQRFMMKLVNSTVAFSVELLHNEMLSVRSVI